MADLVGYAIGSILPNGLAIAHIEIILLISSDQGLLLIEIIILRKWSKLVSR